MKAKLVHIGIPTADASKTNNFYSTLFGLEFARSLTDDVQAYHIPISKDGLFLSVGVPPDVANGSGTMDGKCIVCYFAVDDLNASTAELVAAGGEMVKDNLVSKVAKRAQKYYGQVLDGVGSPVKLPSDGNFFKVAYLKDPNGHKIALMEIDPSSHIFFGLNDHKGLTTGQLVGHKRALKAGVNFDENPAADLPTIITV